MQMNSVAAILLCFSFIVTQSHWLSSSLVAQQTFLMVCCRCSTLASSRPAKEMEATWRFQKKFVQLLRPSRTHVWPLSLDGSTMWARLSPICFSALSVSHFMPWLSTQGTSKSASQAPTASSFHARLPFRPKRRLLDWACLGGRLVTRLGSP